MAPPATLDRVVAHGLAQLRERAHVLEHWAIGQAIPDNRVRRKCSLDLGLVLDLR